MWSGSTQNTCEWRGVGGPWHTYVENAFPDDSDLSLPTPLGAMDPDRCWPPPWGNCETDS